MTEIEMEVDMTKPLELDGHIDDDIIDFDTDMHDQHEPTPAHIDDSELLADAHQISEEIHVDIEDAENHVEQEGDEEMSEEVDLGDGEETMRDVDDAGDDVDHVVHDDYNLEDPGQDFEQPSQGEYEDYVEISHNPDEDVNNTKSPADQSHELDEIDYEIGENPEKQEPHGELESAVEDDLIHSEDPVHNPIEAVSTESTGEGGVVASHEENPSINGTQNDTTEEAEITYDETEDQDPEHHSDQDDEAHVESPKNIGNDEIDEVHPETEVASEQGGHEDAAHDAEESVTAQSEIPGNVEFDAYDVAVDVDEERNDDQEATADLEHEPSPSEQNSAVVSDDEFPAITVQYKGDEFPLFSHGSNGFFTETSILDETMDKLLAGFREELSSEICHEDELVFQVDELGLEFAESSWRDSLSSVTLRQILEIFDLLVKNQDPDSSRTLYAYLFTKPCASKRLESLIESATAGKGLDEVIHVFESPVPVATRLLDPDTTNDGPNEYLDEYDSPIAETDVINNEELQEDAQDVAEVDDDDNDRDQSTRDGDYTGENDGDANPEDLPSPQDEGLHTVAPHEHDETNAHDESESNPFINLELDNETEENEVDLEADGAREEQNSVDPDEVEVGTAGTSATTTLKDEDDTGSIIVDIGADVTATEPGDTAEVDNEDELEEIDWRDDPDANDEVQSPPSVAGKRARGDDDEFDVEDEQDVKRRRP